MHSHNNADLPAAPRSASDARVQPPSSEHTAWQRSSSVDGPCMHPSHPALFGQGIPPSGIPSHTMLAPPFALPQAPVVASASTVEHEASACITGGYARIQQTKLEATHAANGLLLQGLLQPAFPEAPGNATIALDSQSAHTHAESARKCAFCGKSKPKEKWRPGPDGPGTLCDCCGVSYKRKKLREERECQRLLGILGSSPQPEGSSPQGARCPSAAASLFPHAAQGAPYLYPPSPATLTSSGMSLGGVPGEYSISIASAPRTTPWSTYPVMPNNDISVVPPSCPASPTLDFHPDHQGRRASSVTPGIAQLWLPLANEGLLGSPASQPPASPLSGGSPEWSLSPSPNSTYGSLGSASVPPSPQRLSPLVRSKSVEVDPFLWLSVPFNGPSEHATPLPTVDVMADPGDTADNAQPAQSDGSVHGLALDVPFPEPFAARPLVMTSSSAHGELSATVHSATAASDTGGQWYGVELDGNTTYDGPSLQSATSTDQGSSGRALSVGGLQWPPPERPPAAGALHDGAASVFSSAAGGMVEYAGGPAVLTTRGVGSSKVHEASDRRRTVEAKLSCTVEGCGGRFTARHNLKSHLRAHRNEKEFKCQWCDQRFVRRGDCKRHERRHCSVRRRLDAVDDAAAETPAATDMRVGPAAQGRSLAGLEAESSCSAAGGGSSRK